ncbi:mandelate racemase/muconate lactonizing enzyme family protein [Pseudaminobacter sp. 19-2017]|uniref:Mandelate racemase/muconate lactonizing enzyme family protein n=1 Tax=Pseudaminobacter soli (ex Zhang et al. 2022) TaxID=2831468 RepID=A0A942DUY4_9HYPH|nr:mandelate racemase/muconate lactonizing enzyme family protein [Pseudaminobacter soli]
MTRIEAIDLFLLQVPDFDPARDPVKDTLLVRARAGQYEGWGEGEAAPFVSLAAFVTPESHSTSRPVGASVLGQPLEGPADIVAITRRVLEDSMNVLQAPHVYSGVEMALWDLLGKKCEEPVYRLLGYDRAFAKQPYVVIPFAATPEETFGRMRQARQAGYRAVKTGWNGFGSGDIAADGAQLAAAREGLGTDARLFLDAARIWGNDPTATNGYGALLDQFSVEWVEEPFEPAALEAYAEFSRYFGRQRIAAGENIHSVAQARHLFDIGGVGVIQIDCGRVGGIGAARDIARYVDRRGGQYVNHTYTSHLALSASLHAYAGLERQDLCEYPMDPSSLSWAICREHLALGADGKVELPDAPGLGIAMDLHAIQEHLLDVEIRVGENILYRTPNLA